MPCPIMWYLFLLLLTVSRIIECIISVLHASSKSCWNDQRLTCLFFASLLVRRWLKQWRVGCKSIHRIGERLIINAIFISMLVHVSGSYMLLHSDVSNDTSDDVIQAPSSLIWIAPFAILLSRYFMSFFSDLSADWQSFNTDRCDLWVISLDAIEAR